MTKKLFIMLIDDNKIDLYLYNEFIKHYGIAHNVITYTYAGDALNYLNENEESHWPDLILLDIQMPEMDGFEFLDKYEKFPSSSKQKCHIVMLSSSLDFIDLNRAHANSQVLELLKKPLNMHELVKLLNLHAIL